MGIDQVARFAQRDNIAQHPEWSQAEEGQHEQYHGRQIVYLHCLADDACRQYTQGQRYEAHSSRHQVRMVSERLRKW